MLRKNYYLFLITLIMMGSCGLFATDIFVPALPSMTDFFHCTADDMKASFTVYLMGLAACQLVTGILADRFGRKKVAFMGFSVFILSTFLCTRAETLSEFLCLRVLQAVGAGVGSVINRALIVDQFSRQGAVKIFSTIFPVIGLSAAVAPLIGGFLTDFFHWHASFYFIMCFGVVTLALVIFCVEEKTHSLSAEAHNAKIFHLPNYINVIKNMEYIGYVLVICAGFCVFRVYTAESAFLFDELGYTASGMGHFYIPLSTAYIVGNLSAKRLVNTFSVEKVLKIGLFFFVSGGLGMIFAALFATKNPYALIIPMTIVTLGNGVLFPVASAGAMTSVANHLSGLASGLMGSLQFISAAMAIYFVGSLCHGDALSISLFIGGITVFGLVSYLLVIMYRLRTLVREA